ncbi:MAG: hypothetical protein ACE366_17660 [Bradymonadia bacterium]
MVEYIICDEIFLPSLACPLEGMASDRAGAVLLGFGVRSLAE